MIALYHFLMIYAFISLMFILMVGLHRVGVSLLVLIFFSSLRVVKIIQFKYILYINLK